MDLVTYKDFEIAPSPKQLADTGCWTVQFSIQKHSQDWLIRQFSAGNTYPTKDEAVAHSINAAKQIIDGMVPGLSVSDLA